MGFEVEEVFRVSPVFGTVFTFQLIYIHANKEINATKLYRLKDPRNFQDLFLYFYRPNQKRSANMNIIIPVSIALVQVIRGMFLKMN